MGRSRHLRSTITIPPLKIAMESQDENKGNTSVSLVDEHYGEDDKSVSDQSQPAEGSSLNT